MMKWYENHRHNWSYCHDLRFWISFYFLWGWEAVEYGEIPPFCVYAICHNFYINLNIYVDDNGVGFCLRLYFILTILIGLPASVVK